MNKNRNFQELLGRRFGCARNIGVELNPKNTPPESTYGDGSVASNMAFVKATRHFTGAYEINFPVFSKDTIRNIIRDINDSAPEIPVILKGCNCPDVAFGELGADAVTGLSPYPGGEMLSHFFLQKNKGVFTLCYGLDGKFQDNEILFSNEERRLFFEGRLNREEWPGAIPAYEYVAHSANRLWNKNGNCGLDVDAGRLNILARVRAIVGDMPIIVRHIGTKKEDIARTMHLGKDKNGQGLILFPNPGTISQENPRGDIERLHLLISGLNA